MLPDCGQIRVAVELEKRLAMKLISKRVKNASYCRNNKHQGFAAVPLLCRPTSALYESRKSVHASQMEAARFRIIALKYPFTERKKIHMLSVIPE